MNTLPLINNSSAEVSVDIEKSKMTMKLKGIVSSKQLKKLRETVAELFGNVKAERFEMDLSESEYQEFDFNEDSRKLFYKSAEKAGVRHFILNYPNEFFYSQLLNQWRIFFEKNNIRINVIGG